MLAEDLLLPNEVCEPLRPHAECERSRLRQALIGRVEKRSPTAPKYAARVMTADVTEEGNRWLSKS